MNLQTTKAALSLLERREDFAWVTILSTHGSSPRHSGAAMLVRTDGSITGTIGGGPLEATAINDALRVLETRELQLTEFDSPKLGMMCGGGGMVLIEYIDASRAEAAPFFRDLLDLLQSGQRAWLVTAVPESGKASLAGKRLVAEEGGTYDRIMADGPANAYVQPVGARGAAYVFGAGHCGEKLVPVLSLVGFATVIVDDRAEFANRERFPTADQIVVPESFSEVVGTLPIDEDSYVVIVTRGHAHDKNVLTQALRTPAGYLGMIGSKNKVARVFEALREEGFSSDDLARVHAPIGLSIGAETPEEIAISIAGQLIQARASKGK